MPSKGLCFYTDNRIDERLAKVVRGRLRKTGFPIVSVSHEPIPDFGKNIVVNMMPDMLTMFKQILIGLEASKSKVIFITEHDVLYDPSHFEFTPPKKDVFYYNINIMVVNVKTVKSMIHNQKQVSGLCAYRKLLVKHYHKRLAMLEKERTYMMFEPGMAKNIDNYEAETWMSECPNIDLRHGNNFTRGRFANLR